MSFDSGGWGGWNHKKPTERPSQVLVRPRASPGPDVLPSPADSSDVASRARAKSLRLHHKTENGVGGPPRGKAWELEYRSRCRIHVSVPPPHAMHTDTVPSTAPFSPAMIHKCRDPPTTPVAYLRPFFAEDFQMGRSIQRWKHLSL